jgi:hypothetical protein
MDTTAEALNYLAESASRNIHIISLAGSVPEGEALDFLRTQVATLSTVVGIVNAESVTQVWERYGSQVHTLEADELMTAALELGRLI